MQSSRALGILALCAVILAAISFAAVDVTIAAANGCMLGSDPCADSSVPGPAVGFAIIGTAALLVSVLPAITWFVHTIRRAHHDAEHEPVRISVARPVYDDDDL